MMSVPAILFCVITVYFIGWLVMWGYFLRLLRTRPEGRWISLGNMGSARRIFPAGGLFILPANSLPSHQRPRILATDYLGNFAAFLEDLDFSATITGTLPRIA